MSEKDYLEKSREELGLLEKIMSYIPGYRGYKEKELRRESDRLVRTEVVNKLKAAKNILRRKFADPAEIQKLSSEDAYLFESLLIRLDRVTQRIDKAVAGYAGIFDAVKVKENKLDAIIQHDLNLIEKADFIKMRIENLTKMETGKDEWKEAINELISKVGELDELVDQRSEFLRGLRE